MSSTRRSERGQAFVLMVGVMLLSIAMLAAIIDGGNVITQRRAAQSAADSTAEAGAIVLAQRIAGVTTPAGGWDAEVNAKVQASAAANNLTLIHAYYTDICGIPLQWDGSAALNADGTEDLARAHKVGGGSLPGGSATTPDCPSRVVGPVAGVTIVGVKDVDTYVARAIGIESFTAMTRATAVAGYLQGYCGADQGEYCGILPIAIPVNTVGCDGSNNVMLGDQPWAWNTILTIPLCNNSPGNVGWLDWDPPAGGATEIVCSIINADNPAIVLPSWQYIAATGNTNGGGHCIDDETGIDYGGVEAAVRKWEGQVILIPQFDMTCRTKNGDPNPVSTQPAVSTGPNFGCPNPVGGGEGQNIWYRIPSFAYFVPCSPTMAGCGGRHGAYISGSNKAECDTGNGSTSCLVGKFMDILGTGTVGPGVGAGTGSKALGVQLIK
ncbi:MAG TPA: pilus assembly protein TadG-related protein [Candidatus Binatia bacterium]|nr:pilus assembly protein TadG-related protein [Candidatus Binatia bacterium]